MQKLLFIMGLGMAVCLLAACSRDSGSPRIVCELRGRIVPTAYTFNEFKQTLAAEHGQVEATGYEQLKTASLAVFFTPLDNNRVLAERVVLLSGKSMSAAVLFGLTNAPAAPMQFKHFQMLGSNVPAAAAE